MRSKSKDLYAPSLCGVGFFGDGDFRSWVDRKLTPEYLKWANMIKRCYEHAPGAKHASYEECTVHPDWHNFQEFSKWLVIQKNWGMPAQDLDKDLLFRGNKEYSSEACVLIPSRVNYLLIRPKESKGLPVGVNQRKRGSYYVKCRDSSSFYRNLGSFSCQNEAFGVYKEFKEKVIKEVALEYRSQLDPRAFEALMRYEVMP